MQPMDELLPSGSGFESVVSPTFGFSICFRIRFIVHVVVFVEVPSRRPTVAAQYIRSLALVPHGISSLIFSTARIANVSSLGSFAVLRIPCLSSSPVSVDTSVPSFHASFTFVRRPRVVLVDVAMAVFRVHLRRS